MLIVRILPADENIKEFTIQNYHTQKIIKSPINENLWLIDQNKSSYEFDISKGELRNLAETIGDFAVGLNKMNITDEYDPNLVWLGNFKKGVFCFDKSVNNFVIFSKQKYFNDESISIIKPDRNRVWIGTTKSLYYFERSNSEIIKTPFQKEIWIHSIRLENENIIINNQFEYDPLLETTTEIRDLRGYKFDRVSEFQEYGDVMFFLDDRKSVFIGKDNKPYIINSRIPYWNMVIDENTIWFPSKGGLLKKLNLNDQSEELIKVGNIHNLFNDDECLWFFDEFGLGKINKKDHKVFKSDISFPIVRSFYANEKNIWIGINNGVIQISKKYLDSVMIPREQIAHIEQTIDTKRKKLKKEKDPIKFVNGFFEMQNLTTSHKIIGHLARRLKHIFVIREQEQIERFEKILANETDLKMREAVYYGLICGYSLNGDPESALLNYEQLKKQNKESLFLEFISDRDLARLNIGKHQIDSLSVVSLSEPARLYHLGKIYYEMSILSWNYCEVGINTDFPFSFYKQVIAEHPTSEWADNAEFEMLQYNDFTSHEGGDNSHNLSLIDEYKKFIEKYPDSELNFKVLHRISNLYFYLAESWEEVNIHPEDLGYLAHAKSVAESIPESYEFYDDMKELLNKIETSLDLLSWDFQISSDLNSCAPGENIYITFSLENILEYERKLLIWSNYTLPNFGVVIKHTTYKTPKYFKNKLAFIEDVRINEIEGNGIEITVESAEKYFEK